MKTTYLKCHHGNEKRFGCAQCQKEKNQYFTQAYQSKFTQQEDKRIPIYRGCGNEMCFCTGACKEIIGYQEPE